jgi:hypothetical protein
LQPLQLQEQLAGGLAAIGAVAAWLVDVYFTQSCAAAAAVASGSSNSLRVKKPAVGAFPSTDAAAAAAATCVGGNLLDHPFTATEWGIIRT